MSKGKSKHLFKLAYACWNLSHRLYLWEKKSLNILFSLQLIPRSFLIKSHTWRTMQVVINKLKTIRSYSMHDWKEIFVSRHVLACNIKSRSVTWIFFMNNMTPEFCYNSAACNCKRATFQESRLTCLSLVFQYVLLSLFMRTLLTMWYTTPCRPLCPVIAI